MCRLWYSMGIHPENLKRLIIQPVLAYFDWESIDLETLLLGTAAQETHLGKYLKQGFEALSDCRGVARGIYGMEPNTYDDINTNYLAYRPALREKILKFCFFTKMPTANELISNLKLATIMARL